MWAHLEPHYAARLDDGALLDDGTLAYHGIRDVHPIVNLAQGRSPKITGV